MMTKLQQLVESIQSQNVKTNLPEIRVGDLVQLGITIQEGDKQRVQPFQGVVLAQHKDGANSTITVRKIFQGIGVERVFAIHAPCINDVEILRSSQISRSKLYYLRNRTGKATRLKQKFQGVSTNGTNS